MSPTPEAKRVYLVRHAESEQNVATRKLENGDLGALITVCRLGMDAQLSQAGQEQLEAEGKSMCSSGFADKHGVQLVVHSPLQRARDTAIALFGGHPTLPPLLELPFMYERTPVEYLMPSLFDARINRICTWLAARPESVLVLVGHGQLWKRATHGPHLDNVGIMECTFNGSSLTAVKQHPNPAQT